VLLKYNLLNIHFIYLIMEQIFISVIDIQALFD